MPRAVDPPGVYATADYDPEGKDLFSNPAALPSINLLELWAGIIDRLIHQLLEFIRAGTGIDLMPVHELLEDFWDGLRAGRPADELLNILGGALIYLLIAVITAVGGAIALVEKIMRALQIGINVWADLVDRVIDRLIEFILAATGIDLGPLRQYLSDFWDGVRSELNPADLLSIIGNAARFIINAIMGNLGGPVEFVQKIIEQLQINADAIRDQLISWVTVDVPAAVNAMVEQITGRDLQTWAGDLNTAIGNAVNDAAQAIWYWAELLQGVGVNTITALAQFISDLWTMLTQIGAIFSGQAVTNPLNSVVGQFNTWWSNVGSGLPGLSTSVQTALTNAGNALSAAQGAAADLLATIQAAGAANAAALGTAVAGAVANAGTALSNATTALTNAGSALAAAQGAANDIAAAIAGAGAANAAALGTAVSNAVTNAGTALTNAATALSNAQNAANNITAAITAAGAANAAALGTAVVNAATNANTALSNAGTALSNAATALSNAGAAALNAQGVIDALQNAAAGTAGQINAALSTAQTNLTNLFNSIPNYLQGLTGTFGQSQVNSALSAQAAANAAAQAQIAAIQSAFAAMLDVSPAGQGGISQTVDFTNKANQSGMAGIMLPGTGAGPGYMGITNGAAAWQGGTGSDIQVFPEPTASDYQVIDATLGPLNNAYDLPLGSNLYVPFRINSTRNTYTAIALHGGYGISAGIIIYLVAAVNGTETILTTSAALSVAAGGTFRIIAGDRASQTPQKIQILYNGTPIISFTHNTVPQIGPGFRYTGLRMNSPSSASYPPAVKTVSYQDNPPPPAAYPFSGLPAAGTKGRVYLPSDTGLLLRDNGSVWERFLGGPLGYFTAPPAAGWTAVNLSTAATVGPSLDGRLMTATSVGVNQDNWRLEVRPLSPAANFIATAYLDYGLRSNAGTGVSVHAGLILYNGTQLIVFGLSFQANVHYPVFAARYANVGLWNSNLALLQPNLHVFGRPPNWLRIRDDGTNRYYEYSYNGIDWINAATTSRTDYFTATQIGYGLDNYSGNPATLRLRSLSGVT